MKIVIDTNVWVSGLLWGGIPNQVLRQVRQGLVQALVTDPLLAELAQTLTYPKLQTKLHQLQETPDSLLLTVQELTTLCTPMAIAKPPLRDPKDLIVLEAALGGKASGIITGDRDLLVLGNFSDIPILLPQDFLKHYFP
ncbi:MAG TPA: putative toxin-antitoxin system toxin component, PIN family [Nodosilinea sp.]|nr:putative toxin-antitoxin system toxin component, PIN family [Nodosilinea sp.]